MTKTTHHIIGLGFLMMLLCISSNVLAKRPESDDIFRDLILQRLHAYSSGDFTAYQRLISENFVHIDDNGNRRTAAEMKPYTSVGDGAHWQVSELHRRRLGEFEIVDCISTSTFRFGPREMHVRLREMDIFEYSSGRWHFLQHSETRIAAHPEQVVATRLDDYVGLYELSPGYIETITRKGNALYVQATGDDAPTPLHAATAESFFVEGDPGLNVFVRDVTGKVTGEVEHFTDGQVLVLKRLGK